MAHGFKKHKSTCLCLRKVLVGPFLLVVLPPVVFPSMSWVLLVFPVDEYHFLGLFLVLVSYQCQHLVEPLLSVRWFPGLNFDVMELRRQFVFIFDVKTIIKIEKEHLT